MHLILQIKVLWNKMPSKFLALSKFKLGNYKESIKFFQHHRIYYRRECSKVLRLLYGLFRGKCTDRIFVRRLILFLLEKMKYLQFLLIEIHFLAYWAILSSFQCLWKNCFSTFFMILRMLITRPLFGEWNTRELCLFHFSPVCWHKSSPTEKKA